MYFVARTYANRRVACNRNETNYNSNNPAFFGSHADNILFRTITFWKMEVAASRFDRRSQPDKKVYDRQTR